MISFESLDYYERRIQRLESMYFLDPNQADVHDEKKVVDTLAKIESKMQEIQVKVPEVDSIVKTLNKIYPILSHKRKSLKGLGMRVNQLMLQKEEVSSHLNSLLTLRSLSDVVNKESYSGLSRLLLFVTFRIIFLLDAEMLNSRLQKIEMAVELIRPQINQQMKEVDELIDLFEKGVCCITFIFSLFFIFSFSDDVHFKDLRNMENKAQRFVVHSLLKVLISVMYIV
jgi:hypothetical protein